MKLNCLREKTEKPVVMILGLGSVGTYLLDYLLGSGECFQVVVVGRTLEKMEMDVNIVRIGALIRGKNRSEVLIENNIDFNNIDQLGQVMKKYKPDFIINTSRAYSGLKYGSISWNAIRAYGIWTPLAIKYIRNIMEAYKLADINAIVINTSYSDAVIPWLKSAGKSYPDFGSGNLNHLIPRIQFAAAKKEGIKDYWNIEVMFATAHFHDVVISKEGHTEGIPQLLRIFYQGRELLLNQDELFIDCKIPMPTDAKRNMMNASSNFAIIQSILKAIREKNTKRLFSPGAFGEIGGYPVVVDGAEQKAYIDESVFSMEEMRKANRKSIALDGVEDVIDGMLVYTDALLEKVENAFLVKLPKYVPYEKIDETAEMIIQTIIIPQTRLKV
ncbi:saccharopine dehydrogenase NADP-binding domain-containing protein [Mediterraneibacter agrestimuris]|uniref:saccharopine dehydrogenase NADP-binding domain-containing protein n=1 Tax=Mediterraneibacter agrestimuris TaxID=2941333 RepID=UPI00203E3DBB|nr:saccharopine dehydrogenase NADP-binding domain-containing protein [Mediterraneibacter agrestimuris]